MYGNGQLPVTGFSGIIYAVVGLALLSAAGIMAVGRRVLRRN